MQAVLSIETSLSIIYVSDYCCKTTIPTTSHQIMRLVPGKNVQDNVDWIFPTGPLFDTFDDFVTDGLDLPILSMMERSLAVVFVGSLNFRELQRQAMNDTITAALPRLTKLAEAYDTQVIYEMIDYNDGVYTDEDRTGYSYLELIRNSKLTLVPVGDQWLGGRLFQALELGEYYMIFA